MKFLIDFELDKEYESEEAKRDAYIEYMNYYLGPETYFTILEDEISDNKIFQEKLNKVEESLKMIGSPELEKKVQFPVDGLEEDKKH